MSYAYPEARLERGFGNGYLARCNVEFAKMCARGLTVLAATGDGGAGDVSESLGLASEVMVEQCAQTPTGDT